MSKKFQAEYEVDDGYVGPARPKYFEIFEEDIEDDMEDEDFEDLFYVEMDEAFNQDISPYPRNLEEFKVWAREVRDKKKEMEEFKA